MSCSAQNSAELYHACVNMCVWSCPIPYLTLCRRDRFEALRGMLGRVKYLILNASIILFTWSTVI